MEAVRERLETERLTIRELRDDDLARIFDVYASNAAYLELTSGAAGEPGRFDLAMLERDVAVARAMPGRHVLGIYAKEDEPVGVVDWIEENPVDGRPWIGLVLVRADRQRQGIAREAVEALLAELRQAGAQVVRASVVARNAAGLAFARSLGFEQVATRRKRLTGEETLLVFERRL
jgi:RimJ/RimL family protein N-acetyltransferase